MTDENIKNIKNININNLKLPDDLKKLTVAECEVLCKNIRQVILNSVMKNGGHLASNLGTVELTLVLHRVFSSPEDKIIWDVGHQAYTHKILTGRLDRFNSLRKENGLAGFIKPSESVHDAFISGHSSTSISVALGMAEAMKLNGDNTHKAIAVIGDGAFTGGLAYEGLNNAGKSDNNIIVILNHNEMSISKNVGAFAKYLTSVRGNQTYLNTKKTIEAFLNQTPFVGEPLKNLLVSSKSALKLFLYHSTMFEDLGFAYIGPVDGHNIAELDKALRIAQRINKPVFVHVNTVKGKGFKPAEKNPGAFHSIPSCGYKKDNPLNLSYDTYSEHFGRMITELGSLDNNLCTVTAAMKYGTGLQYFASAFPKRFFDVGIAEQHAVTFSASLAKCGKIPVTAIYSSFLQRTYDQLIHDASIDSQHIVLAIDRAGIVGEDGETHQGIFDIPMLKSIPNTTIFSPSSVREMDICLKSAIYEEKAIACVRYPRGGENVSAFNSHITNNFYLTQNGENKLAISFGRVVNHVYEAMYDSLNRFDVLKLVKIHPVSNEIISICLRYKNIVIFEESSRTGGIGEHLLTLLYSHGFRGNFKIIAIDGFVKQASVDSSMKHYMLDRSSIKKIMMEEI